jgi:hypothetical protein
VRYINPAALIEAAFPRELDYGISARQGEVLVADVQCYFDGEHRLRFVRYCIVQAEKIGQRKVNPLCKDENKTQALSINSFPIGSTCSMRRHRTRSGTRGVAERLARH